MADASTHAELKAIFSQGLKICRNVGAVINSHLDGSTILRVSDCAIMAVQMIRRKLVAEMEAT
jgi:hypothetical protein